MAVALITEYALPAHTLSGLPAFAVAASVSVTTTVTSAPIHPKASVSVTVIVWGPPGVFPQSTAIWLVPLPLAIVPPLLIVQLNIDPVVGVGIK